MAYTEVILPRRPVVDRAAAFYLFEKAVGGSLKIRFVSQNAHLSNSDLQTLSDNAVFTIGVGRGLKYTDRKFGSETSAMLHELRSVGMFPIYDSVLNDLALMMDANNDHESDTGGFLRRQSYAITWIMRQAYRLGHDASEINFCFDDEEVVRRAVHVIAMYVEAYRHDNHPEVILREQTIKTKAMYLLPKGNARRHQGPMTVSRYIRDMIACGLEENEIVERAKWFVRVHDRAQARKVAAKEMAKSQAFDTFPLDDRPDVGTWMDGTWVDSDDPYLLEALAENRPLVVMRNSQGNIIIMSKRFDLSAVADIFLSREPERWYYQSNPQLLANGTENVDMEKSGMSRNTIESDTKSLAIPF